ncbi:MAG TPA: BTAD domain-containing putative transcriptional regulator [Gaiellaceae bacterium]|nr:BTAD domain-containing putative transcriptional regulator [Gaiellaceae bacterium]
MADEDTLEFRVLGSFEVFERERPLDVGAGKQRALLALLVLHAGEVVSTDGLIDALWGERPPPSAPNSVHIYVSRLRRALGNGRLETRGQGYVLRLEAEELDLARFEKLLVEGRELLAGGEAAGAVEMLRAALALWRGSPLSDFTSEEFAQGEIARLDELRLSALEERIEADLALSRQAELVPELEALVREHPLRERLRAQLMLALYRSGRQAEALEAYQQARSMLREELGLEPGRVLQELERAILRQDAELDPPERAFRVAVRAPRRSGALIAIGAAVLLLAAVAVAGIEIARDDDPGLAVASPNAVAAIDAGSNRLVADVPVGNGPTSVAVGEGSVWVTNALDRTVSRIDPELGSVVQRIDVGGDPGGIAVGAGAVWVANSLDGTVSRIDPVTNRVVQTIPVGVTPTALAVNGRALWVTSAEERNLTRIDVVRGRVVGRIATDALGRAIAVNGGSIWVTDGSTRRVVRIDARRGSVLGRVSVGNGPTGIAFGDGFVWVVNSLDGTVSRIDPERDVVTATIPVGEGPDGIAVGSGFVWVSGEFSEEIARIDPDENVVVDRVRIANRPKGLAISESRVWFAVQPSGVGHRGGRLVVAGHGLITGSIDPSYMSWAGTISSLSAAYDGLVGYARRGGSEGTEIVPNLAVSLPVITAGEATYEFRLRPRIRYSDGTLVRASDFRRAFERAFGTGLLGREVPLEGTEACTTGSCDLSRGVRTNDASRTIVFHLRRPDSEFLRTLTIVAPIPRGTPDRDTGTRPVPSTGPYKIESYVPERALTLIRNPYFRVWSNVARPNGFPDEIEFRLGGPRTGVPAVERGQVDVAVFPLDRQDIQEELDAFRAQHPSQFHVHAEQATVLLFLNTTHAPFDDVRVRRAVNYAVDRAAISRSYGGATYAPPTCQLRPPGTVGFRRYCPYTAGPSRTGEWKAPDLARARRLVAASGTRGMKVTVWTYPGFWESAAEGSVRALEQLGYRASIRRAADLDAYIAKVTDEKTRGVQAGVTGWYGVPRTAASLLELLRCVPPDNSFFCDERIDARIERALEIQASDPDAAIALWARIERDIVDLAPWVPLFTPSHAHLVSKRVGNYQFNPESRLLFDQLWVR